ncbi:MAG: hypothetical protein AAGB12_05295 [Pseudomonadota bacterium]
MSDTNVTFANEMGEFLAPLLIFLRKIGFFEAYVFIPLMTLVSIALFIKLLSVIHHNGTFSNVFLARYRKLLLFTYFSVCFIFTNSMAVALKTFIVEEMDYETPVWFLHWVAPLHVYIFSVAGALIWIVWRNLDKKFDIALMGYVQAGILAGYYTAFYRLINEPFELLNITTGMSGVFFLAWFLIMNMDLISRFYRVVGHAAYR